MLVTEEKLKDFYIDARTNKVQQMIDTMDGIQEPSLNMEYRRARSQIEMIFE